MSGDERHFHDFLAELFLHDVGLAAGGRGTPQPLTDEEFARIALELGRVDQAGLNEARHWSKMRPGTPLWEVLEACGKMDVDDILAVFRQHGDPRAIGGRHVGRYMVIEAIGEGASGRVYRAIHEDLLKHVALKVLHTTPSTPRDQLERFRREATTAAQLDHPGIVGVHDVGVDGSIHYIAMDLVEGPTLDRWAADHPARQEWAPVMCKVAGAVGFAHAAGVLHRDLKPQNILVCEEGGQSEPVVVDFGLACARFDDRLTRHGALLGTPRYMAPEQARGEVAAIDARSDVYALGVMLYELAWGKPPAPTRTGDGAPHFPGQPADPFEAGLRVVCARCLELEAAWRYPDAGALAADLERLLAGRSVEARRPTALQRLTYALGRRPAILVASLLAGILLAVGGLGTRRLQEENHRLRDANRVQSAYHRLQSELEPVVAAAERVRYARPGTPGLGSGDLAAAAESVLATADAVLARSPDPTGVGAAYRAWVGWLVGESGARARLARARLAHPADPFPPLVAAWMHLRRYAELARWPAPDGTTLHMVRGPLENLEPRETPEMRAHLESATAELAVARATRVWDVVPELGWVEDLCAGFQAYAAGQTDSAVERLERVGSHADLALEPGLIRAFAHCRSGELDQALGVLEALLERRPGHRVALATLAACRAHRGRQALRENRDGREDLLAARALWNDLLGDPTRQVHLAQVDLTLAVAEERSNGDPLAAYRQALASTDQALLERPDDFRLLANRAVIHMQLAQLRVDARQHRAWALEDVGRAMELGADNYTLHTIDLGVRILAAKERLATGPFEAAELAELHGRIDHVLERWGDLAPVWFYRAELLMLEIQQAGRTGVDPGPLYDRAVDALVHALEGDPNFVDARYLLIVLCSFLPEERRLPTPRLLELERELRAAFADRPLPRKMDQFLSQGFDRLARQTAEPAEARDLTAAAVTAWVDLVDGSPGDPRLRLSCARAQLRLAGLDPADGRPWLRAAVENLDAAVEIDPRPAAPWVWRGLGYLLLGDLGGDRTRPREVCDLLALEAATEAQTRAPLSQAAGLVAARCSLDRGEELPSDHLATLFEGGTGGEGGGGGGPDASAREVMELLDAVAWWVLAQEGEGEGLARERCLRARNSALVNHWVQDDRPRWLRTLALGHHRLGQGAEARATLAALDTTALDPVLAALVATAGPQDGEDGVDRRNPEKGQKTGDGGFSER